jgi:anti-sigma B factor antagonist
LPGGREGNPMDLESSSGSLREGDPVEVVARFSDTWVGGFEVASLGAFDCQVLRVCDGEILPVAFAYHQVRPASVRVDHTDERPRVPATAGQEAPSPCVLRLPAELDIGTVEAIRDSVIDAVDAARGEVVLDLDDVRFLDTYGIRLLVTVRRRAWERDLPFRLHGGKPLVRALLDLVGQDPFFHPDGTTRARRELDAVSARASARSTA